MERAVMCLACMPGDPDCPLCGGTGVVRIDDGVTDVSEENELDSKDAEAPES